MLLWSMPIHNSKVKNNNNNNTLWAFSNKVFIFTLLLVEKRQDGLFLVKLQKTVCIKNFKVQECRAYTHTYRCKLKKKHTSMHACAKIHLKQKLSALSFMSLENSIQTKNMQEEKKLKEKVWEKKSFFLLSWFSQGIAEYLLHIKGATLFFPFDSVSLLIKRKRVETSNEKNKKGNAVVRSYGGKRCSLNFNRLFLSLPGSFFCWWHS